MIEQKSWLKVDSETGLTVLTGGGPWTIEQVPALQSRLDRIPFNRLGSATIDLQQITRMDTAGACLAKNLLNQFDSSAGCTLLSNDIVDSMLRTVNRYQTAPTARRERPNFLFRTLENIGKATVDAIELVACFVVFIGSIANHLFTTLVKPARFRLGQTTIQIELNGFNAIPIISLISFLIGVVIAYQGALQLGKLGAEIYTIDLLAVTILREMGILLSAIVIAGRSGSTFAAEIGSMRLNEELDAMHTIGMDPMEVLVLPRLIGLTISLPILTLIANCFGIIGGGLMVWLVMDISPTLFISQFVSALSPWTFWVGLIKAPVFAAVIAVIGCYEGMQVSGSAESLGRHTTRAVVESIFLIIVFDALFSIFFGVIGI